MQGISSFLAGQKILEEVDSKHNGHLIVKKDLAWGTYIQADGVTQSGGVVETIWKSVLKRVLGRKYQVSSVLILGLGGGTIAKLVRKNWPDAQITGVDVDSTIVELGKKYLNLDVHNVEMVIADAYEVLKSPAKHKVPNTKFDLICVDLYCGNKFPKKFENEEFLQLTRSHLAKDGIAIFNRLYYGEKRKEAVKFGNKLEKVFSRVEWFYPEANLMYICRK